MVAPPKRSFLEGKPMVVGYHHFRKPPHTSKPSILIHILYVQQKSHSAGLFFLPRLMRHYQQGLLGPLQPSIGEKEQTLTQSFKEKSVSKYLQPRNLT